jgi:hypothetical protein
MYGQNYSVYTIVCNKPEKLNLFGVGLIKITVVWVMTPCSLEDIYERFEGTL